MTKPKRHTGERRKRANGSGATAKTRKRAKRATAKAGAPGANGARPPATAKPLFPPVPAVKIAELLGVSVRRVGQLAAEGVIPKAGPAEFDPVEVVRGYVSFWRRKAMGEDADVQKARLLALRVEREELAVARIRRTQIPVDQLDRVWSDILYGFRAGVLAIEQQAPRLVDIEHEPEMREVLRTWAHALLETLSERVVYYASEKPAQAPTPKGVKP